MFGMRLKSVIFFGHDKRYYTSYVYLPIRHLFLGGNFCDDVENCPTNSTFTVLQGKPNQIATLVLVHFMKI